jgi:hypothetical protein
VQLSQILARQPPAQTRNANRRRDSVRRRLLIRGKIRAVGKLNTRHRSALERRLAAGLDIVTAIAEIAADQRR